MGNVAKYQHGRNMTFTVVELLMIIPKSTYLSISLPYFSIYHFFSLTLCLYNMYFFRGMVAGRFRLAGYEVMDENYDFPLIPPYPFYYSLFVAVYFYRAALAEQNRFVG